MVQNSHDEHKQIVELCVKVAAKRVPVIAGAGSNSTSEAIDFTQHAKQAGADAVLHVTGYYNKPTQEGIYQHIKAISEAVDIPIFLYNVPVRTGSDISPETMGRLAKLPNVIGVKDASADLGRVARHTALCGKEFIQISGEDPTAVGFNAQGGVGCISVTANVAPEQCARMQKACADGNYAEARRINDTLARLHRALFLEASPTLAKYALSKLGLCTEDVRLPIVPSSSKENKAEVEAAMKEAGVL